MRQSIRNALLFGLPAWMLSAGLFAQSSDRANFLTKQVLAPVDGWASFGPGTTGGAAAKAKNVYIVHTRRELIAALNDGAYPPRSLSPSDRPKIIQVSGVIDANVDDANRPVTCEQYVRDGYTRQAYVAAYDPAVWKNVKVDGKLEEARAASQKVQQERVQIRIGSNTTLIGVGDHPTLTGAWLNIKGATNVIVRNLTLLDTFDCFPQWDPSDGALGNWNSEYDSISLSGSDHVWIDHNTFADRETADDKQPSYFGRHYQIHDGALDITNGADLATVSWNKFSTHDKLMLIGSSDSKVQDRGKLRVTIHHNLFEGVGQRMPRVRFGQVHAYNNYYRVPQDSHYQYSWGVGTESHLYVENNVFVSEKLLKPDQLLRVFKGTAVHVAGTVINGDSVDVLAAYNAANSATLSNDVGWRPELHLAIDDAADVAASVLKGAGSDAIQ